MHTLSPMPEKSGYTPWFLLRRFSFPLLWLIIILFFFLLREIIAPFIGAVLVAFLLAPLVDGLSSLRLPLSRRRPTVPRWLAVVFIGSIISTILIVAVALTSSLATGLLFAVPVTSLGLAVFKVLHRRALRWAEEAERLHRLEEKT